MTARKAPRRPRRIKTDPFKNRGFRIGYTMGLDMAACLCRGAANRAALSGDAAKAAALGGMADTLAGLWLS